MKKLVLLVAMFTVSVNLFARNTSVDAVTAASEYVDDKFRFVDAGGRMIADGAEITITKVTQETDDFTGERTDILYDGISLKNTASGTWNAKCSRFAGDFAVHMRRPVNSRRWQRLKWQVVKCKAYKQSGCLN